MEGQVSKKRVSSVLLGEALALREACRLASLRKWVHVLFESDSLQVIR